jgi:predicted transcriptional regulator
VREQLGFIDKQILRFIFLSHGWVNTNRVADKLGMAWITAGTHLSKLHKFGYVAKGKSKAGRVYWRANL